MRILPLETGLREALFGCAAFADLPEEAHDAIWKRLEQREYEQGERLIRQGDLGESLMLLVGGSATGFLNRAEERMRIAEFHAGDVIGEMALLTREPRTADVVADESTRVLALKVDDFRDVASDHPSVGIVLTRLIAERLGEGDVDGLGGKLIDRYRIRKAVGRGSMAVVYEAEDIESGERVALKMMSHRLVYEDGAMARFKREADILLRLSHPNIARVHRRFTAFRTSFIAMEFCEGDELAQIVEAGPLSEDRARNLIGQLASGLAYLHAEDVIHRDLKPSNVMITPGDRVKLTDFGLAKTGPSCGELPLTSARTLLGTPLYMAPEQIQGHAGDFKTDHYALGCLAYEMLTGGRVFRAQTFFELQEEKENFVVPAREELGFGIREDTRAMLVGALQPDRDRRVLDLPRIAAWAK